MARKLSVRTKEMARAQDRAEAAHNKLENVTEQLRKADIKVELMLAIDKFYNLNFGFITDGKFAVQSRGQISDGQQVQETDSEYPGQDCQR